jgi:hypothetical protein
MKNVLAILAVHPYNSSNYVKWDFLVFHVSYRSSHTKALNN